MAEFKMSFGDDLDFLASDATAEFDMSFEDNQDFLSAINETVVVSPIAPVSHNQLKDRDEADAHPVSAITGLEKKVNVYESHVNNNDIHVTSEDKFRWDQKVRAYRNAAGALVLTIK